ncbi:hypothetical protein CJ178_30515 [Rhodococcus sp. ACPA4]|nr:hypothetical protein CJ178_30515 [Rhodococcus sp. ACPA4]
MDNFFDSRECASGSALLRALWWTSHAQREVLRLVYAGFRRVVAGPSIVAERGFVNVVMKVLTGRAVEGVDGDGRAGFRALCRQWWR